MKVALIQDAVMSGLGNKRGNLMKAKSLNWITINKLTDFDDVGDVMQWSEGGWVEEWLRLASLSKRGIKLSSGKGNTKLI